MNESWHSTVEFGLRRLERFATKAAAGPGPAAWIEDDNTARKHSAALRSCRRLVGT